MSSQGIPSYIESHLAQFSLEWSRGDHGTLRRTATQTPRHVSPCRHNSPIARFCLDTDHNGCLAYPRGLDSVAEGAGWLMLYHIVYLPADLYRGKTAYLAYGCCGVTIGTDLLHDSRVCRSMFQDLVEPDPRLLGEGLVDMKHRVCSIFFPSYSISRPE
jgi:hypothetical protein